MQGLLLFGVWDELAVLGDGVILVKGVLLDSLGLVLGLLARG